MKSIPKFTLALRIIHNSTDFLLPFLEIIATLSVVKRQFKDRSKVSYALRFLGLSIKKIGDAAKLIPSNLSYFP